MKKFLVTLLAIGMAFSCCACGGGKNNDDGDTEPVGTPLTAEDEQKVEEVVEQVDYVLEAMPELEDLPGATVKAAAAGDVGGLRSIQRALAQADYYIEDSEDKEDTEEKEEKNVTFSFDIEMDVNMTGLQEVVDFEGFFKITEDALYAEYTDVKMDMTMNMAVDEQALNMSTSINMPFKLYIDAEEVYIYYGAFDVTLVSPEYSGKISAEDLGFTGRWIDLNVGYVSNDLAEYFEQMFQATADGMRSSLETMKEFFDSNVAGKMTSIDGVYTLNADMIDEYYNAYNSASQDAMEPEIPGMTSMYKVTGEVKFDVRSSEKTILSEKINAEMDLSGLGSEITELLGDSSYKMSISDTFSFYDINKTTIEKPTNVGGWGL